MARSLMRSPKIFDGDHSQIHQRETSLKRHGPFALLEPARTAYLPISSRGAKLRLMWFRFAAKRRKSHRGAGQKEAEKHPLQKISTGSSWGCLLSHGKGVAETPQLTSA